MSDLHLRRCSAIFIKILFTPTVTFRRYTISGCLLYTSKLVEIIRENFDLRPAGIIKMLDLRRPIYRQTAAYGHFGRADLNLPWEAVDKVETLKKYL